MEKENGRVTEAERQGILFRGSFQWNIHQSHQYTSAENRRDNAVDNGKEMAKRHPRKTLRRRKNEEIALTNPLSRANAFDMLASFRIQMNSNRANRLEQPCEQTEAATM